MKIWRKENGNTCIEFEKEQDEMTRFAWILGTGARDHREECRAYPTAGEDDVHVKSAISGYLTRVMLDTYLVGTNYTQEFGTYESPKEYHIERFILNALRNKHNTDNWLPDELEVMRKYAWVDIL